MAATRQDTQDPVRNVPVKPRQDVPTSPTYESPECHTPRSNNLNPPARDVFECTSPTRGCDSGSDLEQTEPVIVPKQPLAGKSHESIWPSQLSKRHRLEHRLGEVSEHAEAPRQTVAQPRFEVFSVLTYMMRWSLASLVLAWVGYALGYQQPRMFSGRYRSVPNQTQSPFLNEQSSSKVNLRASGRNRLVDACRVCC